MKMREGEMRKGGGGRGRWGTRRGSLVGLDWTALDCIGLDWTGFN